MAAIAAAMAGGSALSALGALNSANTAEKAANRSLAFQKRVYREQQGRMQPYYQAGAKSLADLQSLMANPQSLESDPMYQWRMQQGQQALERNMAARGGLLGGAALKELTRYGQGFASNEFQNQFNRLATLAGYGSQAGSAMNQYGQNMATAFGNAQGDMANAQNSGLLGATSAITNGINAYLNYGQNQQMMDLYKQMAANGAGGG